MKTVLVALLLMAVPTMAVNAEVNQEPQKFKTTFTIVYNAIPLTEAAKLEREIKQTHDEACKVTGRLEEVENDTITLSAGSWTSTVIVGDGEGT